MNFGLNKSVRILLFLVLGLIVLPVKSFAISKTYEPAATSSEVVVVYNSSYVIDSDSDGVQDSLQIANYYKTARAIPNINIIGIAATTTEVIDRSTYNSEIKTPLQSALNLAGLTATTKYIVLIKGVPLKIKDSNPATGDMGVMGSSDYSSVDAAVCLLFQGYSLTYMYNNPYYSNPLNSKDYRFKHGFFSNGSIYLDYLVTRLDGRSLSDVKAMIDRSVAAGISTNRGWVLDDNTGGQTSGFDAMASTYTILKSINENLTPDPWAGSVSIITTSTLPVVGYSSYGTHAGFSGGAMPQNYYSTTLNQLVWAPGAVSVTYESFNGYSMASSTLNIGQGQIADFIAVGGSGGIANVYEPYAAAIARENIWAPAYARGYSWADSAYMSLPYIDWVSIVLGDPLMTIGDNVAPEASNLSTTLTGSNYINLSWTNPGGDFLSSTVVRSATSYPANPGSGTVVYSGSDQAYLDTSVSSLTSYYYTVFALDQYNNFGTGQNAKSATTTKNTLNFPNSSSSIAEATTNTSVRVNFSNNIMSNKTVSFNISGTAQAGVDYNIFSSSINAVTGQNYINIPISILDDYIADGPKTIILTLNSDSYWLTTNSPQYTLTITDNESAGLNILNTSILVTEGLTATRTMTLMTQPLDTVILNVSTSSLYTLSAQSLTFSTSTWNVPQTLSIFATDNSVVNVNSTSTIVVMASSSDLVYNATTTSFALVIADNDVNGIGTNVNNLSLLEGDSGQIKVNLLTQPTSTVTININYGVGINGSVTQLVFDSSNWLTQQNLIFYTIDNNLRDGSRNAYLTLTSETVDPSYVNTSKVVTIAITDNESIAVSSSGGGGGGGGSSSPSTTANVPTMIQAVNQNLTIESPSQAGVVSKNFYDSSWVRLSVAEKTVASKTTFNVKNLEVFEVNLPVVENVKNNESVQVAPVNNMIIEVVASDVANKKVESFAKDLSFVIYMPQIASDDSNLNLYYFNETLKKWIIVSNAIFDNGKKTVSFSVNHLTKFAVFKNMENRKELSVTADIKTDDGVKEKSAELVKVENKTIPIVVTKLTPKIKLDKNFALKQKGKFFLALENKGAVYYVDPVSAKRVQIDSANSFFRLKKLASTIDVKILKQITLTTDKKVSAQGKKYAGKFLRIGNDIWYVNLLGKRQQVIEKSYFDIIKKIAIGIKNSDLYKIEEFFIK